MTRLKRRIYLIALAVCAIAAPTLSSPAQPLEDSMDCRRWRIYKFNRDDSVNCGCSCGFFDRFCCS